jgi:hypothetical protein
LTEKNQLLNYTRSPLESTDGIKALWVNYENQTPPIHIENFNTMRPAVKTDYSELSSDAKIVLFGHPLYNWGGNDRLSLNSFHPSKKYVFYMDPSGVVEWVLLNALYKNSYLSIDWFRDGERMRLDPNIHNISLKNIISGEIEFFEEFEKVCGILEHILTQEEHSALSSLYNQWKKTTLGEDRFEEFKVKHGIHW